MAGEAIVKPKTEDEEADSFLMSGLDDDNDPNYGRELEEDSRKDEEAARVAAAEAEAAGAAPEAPKVEPKDAKDDLIEQLRAEKREADDRLTKVIEEQAKQSREQMVQLTDALKPQKTPEEAEAQKQADAEAFQADPAGAMQRMLDERLNTDPKTNEEDQSKAQQLADERQAQNLGYKNAEQMHIETAAYRGLNALDAKATRYPLMKEDGFKPMLTSKEVMELVYEDFKEVDPNITLVAMLKSPLYYKRAYDEASKTYLDAKSNTASPEQRAAAQAKLDEASNIQPAPGANDEVTVSVDGDEDPEIAAMMDAKKHSLSASMRGQQE